MVALRARAVLGRYSLPVWRILLHSLLFGLALSIADLLFNFYLVSLGYQADTAGLLSTVSRAAGMLVGLPIGLLIDRLGSQRALLLGVAVYSGGWVLLLQAEALWALIGAQFIVGAAYLLASTAVTPLLAAVTRDTQRASVFGLNASATLIVGLLGSVLGGVLPAFSGGLLEVSAQHTAAYRLALSVVIGLGVLAMLPVLGSFSVAESERKGPGDAPEPALLKPARLLHFSLPAMLLGVAGGAILPFQNLFFREQFGLSDTQVGVALAWAALGMGLGALVGAPVAAQLGLRRGAALLRLGAAAGTIIMLAPVTLPAAYGLILRGLFVAASYPLVDALAMRSSSPRQRGTLMSVMSVLWAGGWALSAAASGWVQVRWGFAPLLVVAAIMYVASAAAIFTLPDSASTAIVRRNVAKSAKLI